MKYLLVLLTAIWSCSSWSQDLRFSPENPADKKLFDAVSKSDLSEVKQLLRNHPGLISSSGNALSILMAAIYAAHQPNGIAVVEALIAAGANVNAAGKRDRMTPLMTAVETNIGPPAVLEILIKHGADTEAQAPGRGTALHIAARWNRLECARILVSHHANLEARALPMPPPQPTDISDLTRGLPADQREYVAKSVRQTDEQVLASRKSFQERTEPGYQGLGNGGTPLMSAAEHLEIVQFLIENGARLDATDNVGRTVLHEAAQHGANEVVAYLIEKGAQVDARTKNGLTPLHVAVNPGYFGRINIDCARTLLDHGADPNARTNAGLTPLQIMERGGSLYWKWSDATGLKSYPRVDMTEEKQLFAADKATMIKILKKYGAKERIDLITYWPFGAAALLAGSGYLLFRRARRRRQMGR